MSKSDSDLFKEPENQPTSEHQQLPSHADQQQPATERQQESATEHQQLPKDADQQLPKDADQQLPKDADQQLPKDADQQQRVTKNIVIEHSKPAGGKTSPGQSSTQGMVPAVPHLPIMPSVCRSEFQNMEYVRFKSEGNPLYIIQCRGVMNMLHLALSLAMAIILGLNCQLRPYQTSSYSGFLCSPQATFLFVTACASFFTSMLLFVCCIISKKTEVMLFHSFFEIGYYLFYFILLLVGSFCLMRRSYESDSIMENYMHNFSSNHFDAVSIIGLVNGILYGASAFAFLATHYYYDMFLKAFVKREEQPWDTAMPNKGLEKIEFKDTI